MTKLVVYIDDEPLLCRALGSLLTDRGVPHRTFTDPEEGLAFLLENEPTMVLCDYRMPRLDALDIARRLPRPVPFYVVSGDLDAERQMALEPRVTGVLTKPFRAEAVYGLLAKHGL